MKLGLITYDHTHLKTEQLACRLVDKASITEIKIFALPFVKRKQRTVIFQHRPNQSKGLPTKSLSELEKTSFRRWDGKEVIADECDLFVIAGAGILDVKFAKSKPIVNAHPGIIPLTRGLDSFKWAIYNGDPVGNTLHLIDSQVDKGEILTIKRTPVFSSDSLETLARRHYELEIDMMVNVLDYIDKRITSYEEEKPATRRMDATTEMSMIERFDDWKKKRLLESFKTKNR